MGEYATRHDGQRIKIGTCENLTDLRADQIGQLRSSDVDFNRAHGFRFRFPFPDEDAVRPGEFTDYDRILSLRADLPLLSEPDARHYRVQFSDTANRGLLVNLACPASAEAHQASNQTGVQAGEAAPVVQFNGFPGPVGIVQQRIWEARLVLVVECGCCGARYRLPDETEVQPIYRALEDAAMTAEFPNNSTRGSFYRQVAERIRAGYNNPPAWVAAYAH